MNNDTFTVIFVAGTFFYKKEIPTEDNIITKVCGCITTAVMHKIKGNNKQISWIRGAIGNKYNESFVNEVSSFLRVNQNFFYYNLFI